MGEAEIREKPGSKAANAALDRRCHTAVCETLPGSDGRRFGQTQRRSLPLAAAAHELKNLFLPILSGWIELLLCTSSARAST